MRWLLLTEALLVLLIARVASRRISFASVAARMGWTPEQAMIPLSAREMELSRQVGSAVMSASRIYRMKDACLAESFTVKWMLGRRGVATTLVMGWRIRGSAALASEFVPDLHAAFHAWVEAGGLSVTGETGSQHKTIGRYC